MKPQYWSSFLSVLTHHPNTRADSALEGNSSLQQSPEGPKHGHQRPIGVGKFWTPAKQTGLLAWLLGSAVLFPVLTDTVQSYTLPVRVDRWLEVEAMAGTVDFYRNNQGQPASISNTRLEQVGDRIITGDNSTATLAVDTGIGYVTLAENTDLSIQELSITDSGGRVTRLNITAGQARLQVRPFLNPESELEIRTPAGVSGVRGTEFDVNVTSTGRTGVATREGLVDASAQGVTVLIDAGYQSMIVPGFPPTPPVPISDSVEIDITRLHRVEGNQVRIAGRIDPFSQLTVDGEVYEVNSEGWFSVTVPRLGRDYIPVTVSTLSGKTKDYALAVP